MHGKFTALDDYKFAILLNNLKREHGKINDEIINSELMKAWKIGKKLEEE